MRDGNEDSNSVLLMIERSERTGAKKLRCLVFLCDSDYRICIIRWGDRCKKYAPIKATINFYYFIKIPRFDFTIAEFAVWVSEFVFYIHIQNSKSTFYFIPEQEDIKFLHCLESEL